MKPYITQLLNSVHRRDQVELDEKKLESVLAWWQRALGLDAWNVDLVRQRGYELGKAAGRCHWQLTTRTATISLLEHNDNSPSNWAIDDERVIVHELLHLLMAPLDDKLRPKGPEISDVEDAVCIEQPIDWLANLLVALRLAPRGTNP